MLIKRPWDPLCSDPHRIRKDTAWIKRVTAGNRKVTGWLEPSYGTSWCNAPCDDGDPYNDVFCFPTSSSNLETDIFFDYTDLDDPQVAFWWYDPDKDGVPNRWQARLKFEDK